MAAVGVIGRDGELTAVEQFLDEAGKGRAALLIEGEAGIGKTTVWQAGLRAARERAMTTLSSRPGQSEARLTFVGLADLLDGVDEGILGRLPVPQRHALDVALLRAEPEKAPPEQRLVSTAFLSTLRLLAGSAPVVIGIDDLQWLDTPSRHVLDFALRRLEAEPVGFLAAARLDEGASRPVEGARRIRLGPLNLAALHEIIKVELGHSSARPVLVRIEKASAGNPFFALELARAMLESEEPLQGSAPLPVPEDVGELIRQRLRRLPAAARPALLAAAALSQPTLDLLDRDAVAQAEEAGVVRIGRGNRVLFAHPLIASAVYSSAPAGQRREVHRALADRVSDPEERARHLALAAEAPDEDVARALYEAALSARDRGAPDAAIELLELSRELTPAERATALHERMLELARYLSEAGDPQRARAVLESLVEEAPPGPIRAQALILLAFQAEWGEGTEAAARFCDQALQDVEGNAEAQAEIHAAASRMSDHDVPRKLSHANAALELTEGPAVDPALRAYALLAFAEAEFYAGKGIAREAIEQASELEVAASRRPVRLLHRVHHFSGERPSQRLLGILSLYADELDAARAEFEQEHAIAQEHGDELQLARTLGRLALIELRAGRWRLAESNLDDMQAALDRTGFGAGRRWHLTIRSLLDAQAGRLEAAGTAGLEALRMAVEADAIQEAETRAALGFLELSAGSVSEARAHLDRAHELEEEVGLRDPGLVRHHADHIETLIALGDLDGAEPLLERLERQGRALQRPWALATGARCRGLLCAARGDLEGAARALDQARAEHERLPIPFELGRTLLVRGQVHRRRNERRLAKEALLESVAVFERLGSPHWADKARSELRRLGLRRGPRDELTPTEEQIAALAASGLTNRQIAKQVFVSPKTVEANLSRVYRKLQIHSRAELGARMAERESLTKT